MALRARLQGAQVQGRQGPVCDRRAAEVQVRLFPAAAFATLLSPALPRSESLILFSQHNQHPRRLKYPEYFENLKGEEFREMYGSGFMRILKNPSREGHCVSTLIPKRLPEKIDPTLMMRWNMWSMERMSRNPYFQARRLAAAHQHLDWNE